MRGHEDGNRVPLNKPVEAVPIRPSAKPWQPKKPSPETNSHSQLRNDITTKPKEIYESFRTQQKLRQKYQII